MKGQPHQTYWIYGEYSGNCSSVTVDFCIIYVILTFVGVTVLLWIIIVKDMWLNELTGISHYVYMCLCCLLVEILQNFGVNLPIAAVAMFLEVVSYACAYIHVHVYMIYNLYITACRDSNLYLHLLWCTCKHIKYELLVVFNACLVLRGLKTTSKYSQVHVFKYLQVLN